MQPPPKPVKVSGHILSQETTLINEGPTNLSIPRRMGSDLSHFEFNSTSKGGKKFANSKQGRRSDMQGFKHFKSAKKRLGTTLDRTRDTPSN